MSEEDKSWNAHLHRQLVRLGDMIGDGLADEPDGEWIKREYKATLKALNIERPKPAKRPYTRNPHAAAQRQRIDNLMRQRCAEVRCQDCKTLTLHQVRAGSRKADCSICGARYILLKRARSEAAKSA